MPTCDIAEDANNTDFLKLPRFTLPTSTTTTVGKLVMHEELIIPFYTQFVNITGLTTLLRLQTINDRVDSAVLTKN